MEFPPVLYGCILMIVAAEVFYIFPIDSKSTTSNISLDARKKTGALLV